ncbi:hypothetical protein OBBRIDRAFT_40688 [Obba rivulosa]|uniref:Protein kinase domain-containing protein n=1 Tax=Obba rivulosa TaxID=1052685 RepID=A0A8E2AW11_9APHY|nr:hypothetical protein OBBRIDRAFT_40688 [Obba rivulosa]
MATDQAPPVCSVRMAENKGCCMRCHVRALWNSQIRGSHAQRLQDLSSLLCVPSSGSIDRALRYLVTSGVLSLEILPIRTFPIRYALAGLIQSRGLCMGVTIRGVRPRHRCQGAMPPETLPSQLNSSEVSRRHNFNDWDLYTLQRSRCEWRLFIAWLAIMQDRVQPLEPGQSLRIGVPFAKQHFLMRSPWPKVPLSSATRAAVMVGSRGRDITIDAILGKLQYASKRQSDVVFNITSLKSGGDASYSRIVFGTIGSSTRQLCLKLYDERLFPLSRVDEYDDIDSYDPSNRLNNLPFAIDIARTEEAVYDRLSDLQGGLVPQCYGVYQFELPDGMKLWGTLMEDLECPTLEQVDASQWSEAAQMDFIRRMRHAFRALRYAGVRHNDEYARNVLCPPLEQSSTGAPGIVILDFGQSLLWLHDDNGTPPEYYRPDESPFRPLLSKAGIDKALVDRHWEPLDEYEY